MVSQYLSCLATAVLCGLALSSPVSSTGNHEYAVKDGHRAPAGWVKGERAPIDHPLDVSIGLRQNRFHDLEKLLYQGQ
jgi:hypothetical protein